MDIWKTELMKIVRGLLGSPSSQTDFAVLAATVVLSCIVGLRISSGIFGLKRTGWLRVICVFVVTVAAALGAVAAVRIFVLDDGWSTALRLGLQIGAAVFVAAVIGIPAQILLQKGNFLESLFSLAATLVVAALITMGVHAGLQAIRTGGTQIQGAAERKMQIDAETGAMGR